MSAHQQATGSPSLPPLVEGPARGELRATLGPVQWAGGAPAHLAQLQQPLAARLQWWGDASCGHQVPLPPAAAGGSTAAPPPPEACLTFQLRTGPRYLVRYLRDAGALAIDIVAAGADAAAAAAAGGAAPASSQPLPLATAVVGLLALDVDAPIQGSYPLLPPGAGADSGAGGGAAAAIIGSLPVRLEIDYSGGDGGGCGGGALRVVSSFELNEHLASRADEEQAAASMAAGAPRVCCELAAALDDGERAEAAAQQAAADCDGADQLEAPIEPRRLLPLLLPGASAAQLEYAAAMLQPLAAADASSSIGTATLADLAAAAAECAALERRLQEQPAAEAVRCLRQLAASLGSRSLDLAAAFAALDGGRLAYAELGPTLQRLCPAVTAEQARCLLAVLAAGGDDGGNDCSGHVTLPALKAALALVLDAQQFPTAEDRQRQQAAVEARRAKEAAAAATALLEQQRSAAAAAARAVPAGPQADRRRVSVSKLKSSLQQRRRASTAEGSQQPEPAALVPQLSQEAGEQVVPEMPAPPQLPGVVMGIPVLPPPPPALPAQPVPAADTAAAAAELPCQQEQPVGPAPASEAAAQPPPPQQGTGAPSGALLQLIQRAEQLKAAMQASGSGGKPHLLRAPASAAAARPALPNLLLPPPASPASLAGAVADGSLSAATEALLAAAKALRLEGDKLPPAPSAAAAPLPPQPPASMASAAAAAAAAAARLAEAADSSDAESDAEDALIESLFFRRAQPQRAGEQETQPSAGAAAERQPPAAVPYAEQPSLLVLRVQLQGLRLADGGGERGSVRCVVKPLRAGGPAQQLTLPVSTEAAAHTVEVPLPSGAGGPGASAQLPPYLFLEVWRHSGSLAGVARVPLLAPPAGSSAAAVVAEGRHALDNILEGRPAGSLYVAAVMQPRGTPPLAAAVQHSFGVRICSAHRLPSAAAYAGVGLRAPDARILRYSFPGDEESLQTKEVPCCSNPSFDAAASHEMVLPARQGIQPLLQDGLLRFDVLDCWADQQQRQQHGWALLPLTELAGLVAEAERGAGGKEASHSLLLPLCTEYDWASEAADGAPAAAAATAQRGPSLKLELSYSAKLCTMDAEEAAAAAAPPAPEAQQQQQQQPKRSRAKGAAGGDSSSSGSEDEENSLRLVNRGSSSGSVGRPSQWPQPQAPAPAAAAAAAAVPQPPAEPFVPATLAVEIVHASGLAAAVREAAAAGGGSGLDRASVVGPHAFARLALFAEEPGLQAQVPPLQTAFVPQSFCPSWRAEHSYPLRVTAGMLGALASQSVRVEVWHRSPRAIPGIAGGGGERREVLLGAGSVPLLDVLRKPQGLRCWVPLASPAGSSSSCAGAVQITVRLTSLGGLSSAAGGDTALLLRSAEAAALLAPLLRERLLAPPGAGFVGQPAILGVHLDLLAPPTSGGSSGSRPKADRFLCRYTLPGIGGGGSSSVSVSTSARVLTSISGGRPPAAAAGGQQQWAAKLNHSGYIAVPAGRALVAALLRAPLLVQVYKQPAGSSAAPGVAASGRSAVRVGAAELDLSPLLWPASSSSGGSAAMEQQRSLSGTFPLLEGVAASQGGASLTARVQLQLQPTEGAAQQAAAAAATGADATAAAWDLGDGVCASPQPGSGSSEGEPPPQQPAAAGGGEPQQQQAAAPPTDDAGQPQQQPPPPQPQQQPPEPSSGAAPSVQQQWQQQAAPMAGGRLLVRVETALHLPAALPSAAVASGGGGGRYRCHVQAVWGTQREHKACTAAVPVHVVDAASLGGTAAWNAELELPAEAGAWAAGAGPGSAGATSLRLNVWASSSDASDGSSGSEPSGAADWLLGCAAVDLSQLPQQAPLAGWWHIVDVQRQRQGQLKATVRPDAALLRELQSLAAPAAAGAAPPPAAAAEPPPVAAPAAPDAAEEAAAAEPDLMQQLAAQMQGLEALSLRLASQPPGAAAEEVAAAAAAALQAGGGGYVLKPFDHLPASDDELADFAPWDTRQEGCAWSGSGSDDGMMLLGVAFEGAVSPGYSDAEEEERPPPTTMLLAEDWMFAISKPVAAADAAAAAAKEQQQEQAEGGEEGGGVATAQRQRVVFRNVIGQGTLGGAPLPSRFAAPAAAAAAAAAPGEAAPAEQRPREQQPAKAPPPAQQQPAAAAAPAAAVHLEEAQELGAPPPLQDGWQWDIRRPAGQGAADAAPPAPAVGQFASMQAAQPPAAASLEQQRAQLLEQQRQRQQRAPGTAATLDEVIVSLQGARGGGGGAAAGGGGAEAALSRLQLWPAAAGEDEDAPDPAI